MSLAVALGCQGDGEILPLAGVQCEVVIREVPGEGAVEFLARDECQCEHRRIGSRIAHGGTRRESMRIATDRLRAKWVRAEVLQANGCVDRCDKHEEQQHGTDRDVHAHALLSQLVRPARTYVLTCLPALGFWKGNCQNTWVRQAAFSQKAPQTSTRICPKQNVRRQPWISRPRQGRVGLPGHVAQVW